MWRVVRPDSINVWNDEQVLNRLKRYYEVFNGRKFAKMIIASRVEVDDDLEAPTKKLWDQHRKA
ncbi:MAG: hypothetical protein QXP17_03300, partial [Candidatus Jordarchaeales archaeon]